LGGVEGSLEEMDVGSVASDHQFSIEPSGILVSADEERRGELFEDGVVEDLEFVIAERAETALGSVMSWTSSSSAKLVSKEGNRDRRRFIGLNPALTFR
jgi:hypothetical protein